MLKIYLDWNIITHLKKDDEDNTALRKAFAKYCPFFIFPFSKAHLHDLGFGNKKCPGYSKDMHNLTTLCNTHLLEYDKEINSPYPYQCTPLEYIEKKEDEIELFLSGFSKDKFDDLLSRNDLNYTLLKGMLTHIRIKPMVLPLINKEVTNLAEMMDVIFESLERLLTEPSVCAKVEEYVKKQYPDEYIKIKKSNYKTIFPLLNRISIEQVGKPLDDLLAAFHSEENGMNHFISLYLTLNLIGYHPDKKRRLLNIITDAIHAYYASRCDIFVTNDHALKEKVEALYYKMGIQTRVIEKKSIVKVMEEEAIAEFDMENFLKNILPTFDLQCLGETDSLYFKELPFRFWGLFNYCAVATTKNSKRKNVIFRLKMLPNDYVYYTELSCFFDSIKGILTKDELLQFDREYIEVFNSRKEDAIKSTYFIIRRKGYAIHLMADPDSPVPLPMMVFS